MSTNQELIALAQPEGNFELDWQGIEGPVDESQRLFQQEIYKRFQDNVAKTLLFLGFSDQVAPLSESLNYLRVISASFVKELAKNPDLELLREKSVVEIEIDTIEHLLLSAHGKGLFPSPKEMKLVQSKDDQYQVSRSILHWWVFLKQSRNIVTYI